LPTEGELENLIGARSGYYATISKNATATGGSVIVRKKNPNRDRLGFGSGGGGGN